MSRSPRFRSLPALVSAALLASSFPIASAAAAPTGPTLRLRAVQDEVVIDRYGGSRVQLDLGVYISALQEPFEIRVHRDSYDEPVEVDQVLRGDDGSTEVRPLPSTILDPVGGGFKDFFEVRILKRNGEHVMTRTFPFCPGGFERQRVNDEGPTRTVYPFLCSGNPFFKGLVWGIEEGWAAAINDWYGWRMKLADGRYKAIVSVVDPYQQVLELPETGRVKVKLEVRTPRRCRDCGVIVEPHRAPAGPLGGGPSSSRIPDTLDPDPSTLPDLVSLPAWGMHLRQRKEKTRLNFGATVWTAGAQSLVVEGFRREGEATMDAYQYFYQNDEPVGRAPVGEFAYDLKRGHRHWHFQQFARYSLLDSTKTEVLRSKKEAFCLAPTDTVDLLLPGAEWSPYNTDLATACGEANSLWIREVLPLGWGDTYVQSVAGQSFDVTNLPNGIYFVAVEANPGGPLHEQTADNNLSLRKVYLKGRPGHRRIMVPPWRGIDTESGFRRFYF